MTTLAPILLAATVAGSAQADEIPTREVVGPRAHPILVKSERACNEGKETGVARTKSLMLPGVHAEILHQCGGTPASSELAIRTDAGCRDVYRRNQFDGPTPDREWPPVCNHVRRFAFSAGSILHTAHHHPTREMRRDTADRRWCASVGGSRRGQGQPVDRRNQRSPLANRRRKEDRRFLVGKCPLAMSAPSVTTVDESRARRVQWERRRSWLPRSRGSAG